MNVTDSEFWNVPNDAGLPTFSYAELLAQLKIDIPSGGGPSVQVGKGACVERVPFQTIANNSFTETGFTTTVYDDESFFDGGTRFVIPLLDPPIERVVLISRNEWFFNATGQRILAHRQNGNLPGSVFPEGGQQGDEATQTAGTTNRFNIVSAPVDVVPGDFFASVLFQNSGVGLGSNNNMFSILVVK